MVRKSLQEIVIPVVTALLEKRYAFAAKSKQEGVPRRRYPKELTFTNLADKYGISPRTLNRWYTGKTKNSRRGVPTSLSKDSSSELSKSRRKLKSAGKFVAKEGKSIYTHISRLEFKHGRPTWRVHTVGWDVNHIADFVWSIIQEKKYMFMFTIWNPQLYPDQEKSGGFISSGWISGMVKWVRSTLNRWLMREQLSRGEIHAIIFTEYK